jgi:putative endonuclease
MRKIYRPAVYIMANKRNGTIYTGVTSNLIRRAYEHKEGIHEGFTKKYGCKLLVYYEEHDDMLSAIEREKQIKAGSRKKKLLLIEKDNPNWNDVYEAIL